MWAAPSLSDANVDATPTQTLLSSSRTSTSSLLWVSAGYPVCVWHAGCFHSFSVQWLVCRSTTWRWNEASFYLAHGYRCQLQCMSLSLPLSCSLCIEYRPPTNTPTHSTLRALRSFLRSRQPPSFKGIGYLPVKPSHVQVHSNLNLNILLLSRLPATMGWFACKWATQVVDAVEMNDRSTDETYATHTPSVHSSVRSSQSLI